MPIHNRFAGVNIAEVQAQALLSTVIFTGFAVCGVAFRYYVHGSDPTFKGLFALWAVFLIIFLLRNRIGVERCLFLVLILLSGTQFFTLNRLGLLSGAPYLLMFGFALSGLLTERKRVLLGSVIILFPMLYMTGEILAGRPAPTYSAEFAAHPSSWLTSLVTAVLLGTLSVVVTSALIRKITSDRKHYRQSVFDTMTQLSLLRDHETGSHIERCSAFAIILLKQCQERKISGSKSINSEILSEAVKLHDIGKIAISDLILNKPQKLTDDEFNIIKSHTTVGAEIIEQIAIVNEIENDPVIVMGRDITKHHHENWDGTGYPGGKAEKMFGENISLPSRIMAIVDVYDALRSRRPYKSPYSHHKTLEIMNDMKGKKFDPELFEVFVTVADQFNIKFDELSDAAMSVGHIE